MIDEKNTQSLKIPRRLNFKQEGILREFISLEDHYQNMVMFSMLRSEWDLID